MLGQKGTVCFICHGSRLIKASICRLVKVKASESANEGVEGISRSIDDHVRNTDSIGDHADDDRIGDDELQKIINKDAESRQERFTEKDDELRSF